MALLLDTHVWIWLLLEPDRLGRKVAGRLEDPSEELRLSPVSVWETLLLLERGRLKAQGDPETWVRRALREVPIRDAALTREVALISRSIDLPHNDPADRFIAASALVHELTLVTADERLLGSKRYRTLACS